MKCRLVLPLSGIDGDLQRLIEFTHIAEEEGWDGIFKVWRIRLAKKAQWLTDDWEFHPIYLSAHAWKIDTWRCIRVDFSRAVVKEKARMLLHHNNSG